MKWWPFKTEMQEIDDWVERRNADMLNLGILLPKGKVRKYLDITNSSMAKSDSLLRMILILEDKVENDLSELKKQVYRNEWPVWEIEIQDLKNKVSILQGDLNDIRKKQPVRKRVSKSGSDS